MNLGDMASGVHWHFGILMRVKYCIETGISWHTTAAPPHDTRVNYNFSGNDGRWNSPSIVRRSSPYLSSACVRAGKPLGVVIISFGQLHTYTVVHKQRTTRYSFITLRSVRRLKKKSFAVALSSKLATSIVSYFPPHLKRVTTLPCKIQKKSTIAKYSMYLTQYHRIFMS